MSSYTVLPRSCHGGRTTTEICRHGQQTLHVNVLQSVYECVYSNTCACLPADNITDHRESHLHQANGFVCSCRNAQQDMPEHKAEASLQHPQNDRVMSQSLTPSSSSSSHDSDDGSDEGSAVHSSAVTVHCDRVTWQRQSSSTTSTHAYAYRQVLCTSPACYQSQTV